NVKKLDAYKDLFGGIEHLSDAMARKVLANVRAMLDGLVKSGKISIELAKEIEALIRETQTALDNRLPNRLDDLAASFQEMANSVGSLNEGLGNSLGLLSSMIKASTQVRDGIVALKAGIENYKSNKENGGGGFLGTIGAIAGIAG